MFEVELSWIQNSTIKEFATKAVSKLPDYFFEVAASSTGKYHPEYSLGSGGLVRHTKAAVTIAKELLNLEQNNTYSNDEKDVILASLILHDGLKHGLAGSKFTVATHPTEVANWLKNDGELTSMIEFSLFEILIGAISSHMGQWNTDYRSKKEILPKPVTNIEKFVHMCDYLASRKYLLFDFGDSYYKPSDFKTNDLQNKINELITLCKTKISNGCDKENLYQVISDKNNNKKNPNSIKSVDVAQSVIREINEKFN